MKKVAIFASVLALVTAISFQVAYSLRNEHVKKPVHLGASIPQLLHGWTVTDEVLGPSEAATKNVWDALRYDEYVFRSYKRNAVIFTV